MGGGGGGEALRPYSVRALPAVRLRVLLDWRREHGQLAVQSEGSASNDGWRLTVEALVEELLDLLGVLLLAAGGDARRGLAAGDVAAQKRRQLLLGQF